MSKRKGYGQEALKLLKRLCWENRIKVVWTYPLARGMYQSLRSVLPENEISNKKIYAALCYHTGSPAYLSRLKEGAARLEVGGAKSDPVTKAEEQLAQKRLSKFDKRFLPKTHTKKQRANVKVKKRVTHYAK